MRILILGGTQFIGRHIAETLLRAGHGVTIFNRGQSPDQLPAQIERLHGDRDAGAQGLAGLKSREWDVCIDVCGYTPRHVRPSAELLRGKVGRYVYISAVSVYGDPKQRPVREETPRLTPAAEEVTEIDAATYGPLKVTCENIVSDVYGARCLLLRPQIVVGPHDPSGRYAYWLERAKNGGDMLAPGDGTDHLQVIDVQDVARFVQSAIENELSGPFNLAGPRFTLSEFIRMLGARNVVWVPHTIIQAAGVTEFALPLYRYETGPRSGLMDVSTQKALAAGLELTKPQDTMSCMQAWLADKNVSLMLPAEIERQLIAASRIQCPNS